MAYKFKENPKVVDLVYGLIPILQKWTREQILAPIRNTVDGEAYGRKENYPVMERSIEFDMKHTVTITIDLNMAASCIEEGRRSGKMPPVAAIQRWIVVKRIMPRNNQTIAQLNYLIRRAIAKNGTRPPKKQYLKKQIEATPLPSAEIEELVDAYFNAFTLLKN